VSDLPRNIQHNLRTRGLLVHGQRLLVAVSGGVDSMVLLHVLHELAPSHGLKLRVAHLNHALRGRSSDADERLVRRAAERLKLPLRVERADVRGFALAHGLSIEMAARKLRHEFLARSAHQLRIPTIAVGHQADDQVELFFLRLLRGSSGEGLAGMKWRNPSPANPKIALIRPMLDQPRSALLDYAAEAGIRFREDASNASLDFQRNRIRHELIPLLRREYQPALNKIVLRLLDILGAEAELAMHAASAWLGRSDKRTQLDPGLLNPSTPFQELPVAVQRRIVQLQLLRRGVEADYTLVENLRCTANKPVTLGVMGDHLSTVVRDDEGKIHLQARAKQTFSFDSVELRQAKMRGKARFSGAVVEWQITPVGKDFRLQKAKGQEAFDADKVGTPILLRHWRPGDRFQPIGMAQSVKLQDLFTNQKVPADQRRRLIVAVAANDEVFWVEGMRISERFKLSKGTIRRLQWRWKRP
jgi:tRNA(Ile)-lysidine synthase